MIGFVCIMHSCKDCSRNTFDTINNFIKSLYKYCHRDFILYLFDNASDKKYKIPNYKNIRYKYIEDQTIRGLAGPYNDGIRMSVEDGCDLIILVNDDAILNESINKFINIVENHPSKNVGLYGPLTNGVIKRSPQLANKPGNGIIEITTNFNQNLNGFLLAFTPEFYHKFKLQNGDLADMRKKWSGGEEIIQRRARANGGRMFIIKDCWVYHRRYSEWNKFEKWSKD